MKHSLLSLMAATALLAVSSQVASAIEVRPAYSTPGVTQRAWERGVTPAQYGHKMQTRADRPGVYIGADMSYIVADGAQDYPERFGGGSVFLGYRYNRFFGMEVGYSRTLEGESEREVFPGITGTTHSTLQQLSVDAIGYMPLNDKMTLLGGVGYGLLTEEYSRSVTGLGEVESFTEDGSAVRLTGGMEYALSPSTSLRGTLRYIWPGDNVNDRIDNLWSYNLGLKYQF